MFKFIIENLQVSLMAFMGVVSAVYALLGLERRPVDVEEPEPGWTYRAGYWKRVVAVAASGVALVAGLAFVPRGYAGVVFDANNGVLETELQPGLNFVVPFKQIVTNVNTQIQIYRHIGVNPLTGEKVFQHTQDTQEIQVPIAVNYRVDPEYADYVYSELAGGAFTIIEPALLRALRTAIGSYSLEDIAPNQVAITTLIEDEIRPQLALHGITIEYVAIEDTIAKPGIIDAIETERIAERNKLTAIHNRDIAITNAEAAVATATGEAESISVIAKAEQDRQSRLNMTPSEYVWYTRWNGQVPSVIAGDSGGFIFDIPQLSVE